MDLNGNKSPDFFEHAMVIVSTYLLSLHYFNPAAFTEYNTIQGQIMLPYPPEPYTINVKQYPAC